MGYADADEDLLRRGKRINNACFDAVVDHNCGYYFVYIRVSYFILY